VCAGKGFLALVTGVDRIGGKDLAEQAADFGLEGSERGAGFNATDDVGPLRGGVVQVRDVEQDAHGFNGEVVVGWRAGEAVAVEALRGDAGDDDGLGVDPERTADDGGIGGIIMLPVFVADDGDHRRAGLVVSVGQEAASGGVTGRQAKPESTASSSWNSGSCLRSCCQVLVENRA